MTRPYNTTPLLEDDGPDLIECDICGGKGRWFSETHLEMTTCSRCNGTGYVDRHDDDGSDAFDAACDDAHERQIDREAGLP